VVNFELPNVPETYVHRIGRTGRAGAAGTAYSFCDAEEKAYLKDIQKLINKSIPVVSDHAYPMKESEPIVVMDTPRGRAGSPNKKPHHRGKSPKAKLVVTKNQH
jgi:ATP-dependent RNA helicase RhlE